MSKTTSTPPSDPPHPQPIGTPPGGGRWTWDPWQGRWQPADAAPADTQTEHPQE